MMYAIQLPAAVQVLAHDAGDMIPYSNKIGLLLLLLLTRQHCSAPNVGYLIVIAIPVTCAKVCVPSTVCGCCVGILSIGEPISMTVLSADVRVGVAVETRIGLYNVALAVRFTRAQCRASQLVVCAVSSILVATPVTVVAVHIPVVSD